MMFEKTITAAIDELCVGEPENRFDAWCKNIFLPFIGFIILMSGFFHLH